ncbi:uncharacterized protein [Nicotiana sylvestris]|uniref:uncharacterized protein n=1 Tax=Nicotiana sylvestris TaxID=4096 RepID=UPI00388CB626
MHFGFEASCRHECPGSSGLGILGFSGAPNSRRMGNARSEAHTKPTMLHDLFQRFRSVEFSHIPRVHNEVADALATLASMLHHPDKAYVDPLHIQVRDQHAYCNMIEEEFDGELWIHDIKEYIRMGIYPVQATGDQKRTIRWLASGCLLSGGVLYKRTPDLGLLRCIDARQATSVMSEVHSGVYGPHISGYVLAKKILRAGYYWLTME